MSLRSGRRFDGGKCENGAKKEKSNENSPKIKSEMQETCSTCDELRKDNDLWNKKCQIYEKRIESLGKINAENGSFLQETQQKIAKLNQVVALLTQQIAEKISENNLLKVESDVNKGGTVKDNNPPDIDKFLKIEMHVDTADEDNLRMRETNEEQDAESNSEMENSENSDDIQVFEEAEDEETEATLDEKKLQTCVWLVPNDTGTSGTCGTLFQSVADLGSHVNQDHLTGDRHGNYTCSWDGCKRNGEPFKTKVAFRNHFRTHTGERPFRCPFEGCGRAFGDRSTLRLHRNTHSRTMYPCSDPGCTKVFSHEQTMKSHYRVRHTGEKGCVCPVKGCGKVFETQSRLGKHCRTHTGEKLHVCPHKCGKSFTKGSSLKRHLIIHAKKTDSVELP